MVRAGGEVLRILAPIAAKSPQATRSSTSVAASGFEILGTITEPEQVVRIVRSREIAGSTGDLRVREAVLLEHDLDLGCQQRAFAGSQLERAQVVPPARSRDVRPLIVFETAPPSSDLAPRGLWRRSGRATPPKRVEELHHHRIGPLVSTIGLRLDDVGVAHAESEEESIGKLGAEIMTTLGDLVRVVHPDVQDSRGENYAGTRAEQVYGDVQDLAGATTWNPDRRIAEPRRVRPRPLPPPRDSRFRNCPAQMPIGPRCIYGLQSWVRSVGEPVPQRISYAGSSSGRSTPNAPRKNSNGRRIANASQAITLPITTTWSPATYSASIVQSTQARSPSMIAARRYSTGRHEDLCEAVDATDREQPTDVRLLFGEDIDAEVAGALDPRIGGAACALAPETPRAGGRARPK